MPTLFDPIALGAVTAPNRILMAPLTRARATRDHVPTPMMAEYYVQRASAGLIITEATGVSQQGLGWPYAPGIWNEEQVAAWSDVVRAVHEAGGRIFCQLWHMGRLVHPSFLGGEAPVSASATTAPAHAHTYEGSQPYTQARPLDQDEIVEIVSHYGRAAGFAIAAGFDGVQVHAANGYLIDQFLRDGTNLRDDDYGGSIPNRIRLLLEVVDAVTAVVGRERTSVRISPNGEAQGVNDSNPEPVFVAAAQGLEDRGIAFLEIREPREDDDIRKPEVPPIAPAIRRVFTSPIVLNAGYRFDTGTEALAEDKADAITFGRPFIANPDLPHRFEAGLPVAKPDPATFYTQEAQGYIDYPSAGEP